MWNTLLLDIRTEEKVEIFKKKDFRKILFNGTEERQARSWKYTQVKYNDIACEQWCESTENLCAISNIHFIIIINFYLKPRFQGNQSTYNQTFDLMQELYKILLPEMVSCKKSPTGML